jgi:glycosyltransferase involved in cell wall biosynthesis
VATSLANTLKTPLTREEVTYCGGARLNGVLMQNSVGCPLVTVVTAVFNGQPHVQGCLESILAQDYPNVECIVFDGNSTDGTIDVLQRYDNRIAYWKSEPDKGVYDAWNKALAEARGEWICFLGVDDEFLPGAVSAYMALASKNPDADYLCSRIRWVHPSGYERTRGGPWTWPEFARRMCTAQVGSMHRRALFDRFGSYDLGFGSASDYEFLLRPRASLRAAYMTDITVMMRGGGMTDGRAALADANRAKIVTGGRNRIRTAIDSVIDIAKFYLRPLRRTLARITAP